MQVLSSMLCCWASGKGPTLLFAWAATIVACVPAAPQVITVGLQHFEVVANPEGTCELMKLPAPGSQSRPESALEVGQVQQKLLVKVTGT